MTEPSMLLDQDRGTVYRAMSLSVRLWVFFVENSNISFLVCLSMDNNCFSYVNLEVFYLGHAKNLYTIQYNTIPLRLT